MRGAYRLVPALVILLTLVSAVPSGWAHTRKASDVPATAAAAIASMGATPTSLEAVTPTSFEGVMPTASAGAWLFILAVVASLAFRTPRRALTVALALVLCLFAYETGIHSVHHLSADHGRVQCVLASAGSHVAGLAVQPFSVEASRALARDAVLPAEPAHLASRAFRPGEGRAPPLCLA